VRSFTRGERVVSVDHAAYRMYCRVWVGIYPLRRFVRRGMNFLRRRLK